MPLVHDPSLAAHTAEVRDSYATAQAALQDLAASRGLQPEATVPIPPDVTAAQEAYQQLWQAEHGSALTLRTVQYFRYVNDALLDGWSTNEDPGPNPVQISQTITVAGAEGAYIEVRQWIARAEPGP